MFFGLSKKRKKRKET